MSSYEIGLEVRKVIDQIFKQMVIKKPFDTSLIEFIDQPIVTESISSLFEEFLETSVKEEKMK